MEPLISIVDDDEPVREALRRVLAAHGLETAVFASGKQLLDSDRLPEMACLIADVKMPEMSGLALHHRLMAAGHRIPTILITGGPTPSGRNQALAEGVLSYVPKPLSEEALLDNVRLALARGAAGHGDAMTGPQPFEAGASGEPASLTGRPHPRSHLKRLEAESIAILREVAAEFRNPVLLYSIGKDSSVLLHLARKAFYPAKPPFPLLHIDTTVEIPRDDRVSRRDGETARARSDRARQPGGRRRAASIRSASGSALHTQVMKTEALKQALDKYGFDAAIGGARRDEEKSRAKERIFSFRNAGHVLGPAEPAAGTVAPLQHAAAPGRIDAGLPAVELDRARCLAIHRRRKASPSCRSISPRSGRSCSAAACGSWSMTTACRSSRASGRNCAGCASARSAAIR